MPADNAVCPPVHLPGRDVRVADDVIDECLQTTLSMLQEFTVKVVSEPTFRWQVKSEAWEQST